MTPRNYRHTLCDETPADCLFQLKTFTKGTTGHNADPNINYLIYCQSGHVRISSTLFHDEILCAGEIMFVPRQSECTGIALSDVTLLIHKFNNTVCCSEKCILSYLYTHRQIDTKIYCCKLTAPNSLLALMSSVSFYIDDQTHDISLWHLKHKELIWVFTHYFAPDELRSFFHPMNAYIKVNDKEQKLDFYKWNPDRAKSKENEVTADNALRTQVAVNSDGKTNEATKHTNEPMKQGQTEPTPEQRQQNRQKMKM